MHIYALYCSAGITLFGRNDFIFDWLIWVVIFEIALRTLEHFGENGLFEIKIFKLLVE